jgi:hypothetical protein
MLTHGDVRTAFARRFAIRVQRKKSPNHQGSAIGTTCDTGVTNPAALAAEFPVAESAMHGFASAASAVVANVSRYA